MFLPAIIRRSLLRSSFHTSSASLLHPSTFLSKDDATTTPPPPSPPSSSSSSDNVDDAQDDDEHLDASPSTTATTTTTTPVTTGFPTNLTMDDPDAVLPATPLDLVGAGQGQPEADSQLFVDISSPPNLTLPVQSFASSSTTTTTSTADANLGTVSLHPDIFGQPVRRDIVQRVIKWQLAGRRQGTHKQKNISEVSGSGKKPWAQKGTGRARAGHRRPPHWRGGARAFAKVPRDYSYKLNKRVRNQGLRSALSAKVLEGTLHIVDVSTLESHKTAPVVSWLSEREVDSAFIVDGNEMNSMLALAAGNIPRVEMNTPRGANVYDIVKHRDLILTKEGLDALVERILTSGRPHSKKTAVVSDE